MNFISESCDFLNVIVQQKMYNSFTIKATILQQNVANFCNCVEFIFIFIFNNKNV